MTTSDYEPSLRQIAAADIRELCSDGPLFPQAWHARIFALIVALVETGKIDWRDFQQRLVEHLKAYEDDSRHGDEITAHYFEYWLEAAEDTLVERGFIKLDEIPGQVERIRETVAAIRAEQTRR
ncbi:nitrile hydratase accessory protein [Agrobacterium vitis]|uniref:nitrile hydratase accessory protein n=1 Tax=Agrobacterium vitis TaxID=373 RepID=UPI0012E92E6F|nr:nitrile hydratase accessory protein [Agrobacterium vitis]